MYFLVDRKYKFIMVGIVIVFALVIKFPVESAFKVKETDDRKVESYSSLISIIGEVAKNNPDSLDYETKSFIFGVAPEYLGKTKYKCGNILTIKYEQQFNAKAVEVKSLPELLGYTAKAFIASPNLAFNALFNLARNAFCIDMNSLSTVPFGIYKNQFGIEYQGNQDLKTIFDNYTNFVFETPLAYLFCCLGVIHILLAVLIFTKCKLNTKEGGQKFLLCAPLFFYNLMTTLIGACSYAGTTEGRYFIETWFIGPLIIVICLYEKDEAKNHNEIK